MQTHTRYLAVLLAGALALAACDGGEDAAPSPAAPEPEPAGAAVQVTGTDDLQFDPSEVEAPAGSIEVSLTSEPSVNHTFTVELEEGDETVVEAAPGQTASGSIDLETGEYIFYCEVPGHREAGMEGTLAVS